MEEVQPSRTINVHGGIALHLEPFIGRVVVRMAVVYVHCEVADANLHMQKPRKAVRQ